MRTLCVLVAAYGIACSASAAPSINCSKVSEPIGSAICATPALAALDQRLTSAYAAILAQLPERDRALFQDAQRQWLDFVRTICSSGDDRATAGCLTDRYNERLKQIENSVKVVDGIRFRRTDIFKARKSPPMDQGRGTQFDILEISYPQIAVAMTPSQERFNQKLAAMAKDEAADFDEGGADITFGFDDIDVGPTQISVNTSSRFYGHGAAHPVYSGAVIHWLRSEGRELTAEDVFAKGSAWRAVLREFCFKAVKREGFVETPEDLNDFPEDPERWLLSAEGLTIRFNPYEVAPYTDGMPEVTIPWSALKPYLAETAAIPLH